MSAELEGKGALITGGNTGIGLAFAELLLRKGCSVVVAGRTTYPETVALLEQYPKDGSSKPFAAFHKTDVVSWPQLNALWAMALETLPAIDIVAPNAGIFEPASSSFWQPPRTETNPDSPSLDAADADPGRYGSIDTNLTAPIRLSQLAIGHWLQSSRQGCLVLSGSLMGTVTDVNFPLYTASKHGLHAFFECLSCLRDEVGIRVGVLAPTAVKTRIGRANETLCAFHDHVEEWEDMADVVQAMYELVVNRDMGDGTILQLHKAGDRVHTTVKEKSLRAASVYPGYVNSQEMIPKCVKDGSFKA